MCTQPPNTTANLTHADRSTVTSAISPSSKKRWYKAHETLKSGDRVLLSDALLALNFDDQGLIPVIAQCATTRTVLMMAWMNEATLQETLKTGYMCYWSRSRQCEWRKGETSGHRQKLQRLQIDCDGDTLLATIEQTGAACHTNRMDCFYWTVDDDTVVITSDTPAKTNDS